MAEDEKQLTDDEKVEKLEELLLSEDLEDLSNSLSRFNIFHALKAQYKEHRHSDFLAWLMDPKESHGIRDYFLKEFLKSAIKDYSGDSKINELSLIDIVRLNLNDVVVDREKKDIDIFIESENDNFVCVIENKIKAGESNSRQKDSEDEESQLIKYAKYVNTEYPSSKKLFIYLSPRNENGMELLNKSYPNEQDQGKQIEVYYVPMNYKQVYDVIKRVLETKSEFMQNEVRIFIEHYARILKKDILRELDDKTKYLVNTIYTYNKDAINLIVELKDKSQEDETIIKEISDLYKIIYNEKQYKNAIDLVIDNNNPRAELLNIIYEIFEENNITKEIADNIRFEKCKNALCLVIVPKDNEEKIQFANAKSTRTKIDNDIAFIRIRFEDKYKLYTEVVVTEPRNTTDEKLKAKRESLINHINKQPDITLKEANPKERNWWNSSAHKPIITKNEFEQFKKSGFENNRDKIRELVISRIKNCKYIEELRDALKSWEYMD